MNKVCVVGSFMMDLVARAPRRPLPGETLAGYSFDVYPGGKGYNQAIAAARYGADVSFVGMLGVDSFGDDFVDGLASNGISHTHVMRHPTAGTGVGLPVVEDSGENSIIIIPRANLSLTPADITNASSAITSADVLVVQLELPLDAVTAAVRIARLGGTLVILNPAPFQHLPHDLLEHVDVLVPNEGEARAFVGSQASTPQELAASLHHVWDRDAVLTLGGNGVAVLHDGSVTTIPAHPVTPVDTVGAGDTFCGVLAAGLANGKSLVDAARLANAAAAIAVTREGGSISAPVPSEVDQLLSMAHAKS